MKKSIALKNSQEIFDDLKKETNITGKSYYDLSRPYTVQVKLIANSEVAPATFRPLDRNQNIYEAHPTTIKAVRADIFATDDDISIFQEPYVCESCKNKVDIQFWKFCPYCETRFKT